MKRNLKIGTDRKPVQRVSHIARNVLGFGQISDDSGGVVKDGYTGFFLEGV